MLNSLVLTGNIGNDPEVFYSSEKGVPIATFNLAFRLNKDKTGWVKVTCFNKLAETVERHLYKGARIGVIGMLDYHAWEEDNGNKRSSLQMIANSIEFIKVDKRDNQQGAPQEKEAAEVF